MCGCCTIRYGDGLEESAELFWENKGSIVAPIGAALTPPGYQLEGKPLFGVFVAAKGRVSLILDRDGDDKADEEKVIATGWTPLPVNVDAVGLAVDPKDHSIYFGLGTPDFSNAYQVGADGVAKYRLDGEHGTIQRIAPTFRNARNGLHGRAILYRDGVRQAWGAVCFRSGGGDVAAQWESVG